MNQDQIKRIASLPEALLPWYRVHARKLPWRETKDPYHVWLSEIMLQQTRVEAVKQYYTRFLETLPTIRSLADADEALLLKLWEGLGYYSRVRNLQKAAKTILETHGGKFPTDYQDILALPGIGAYTAGAIASICFGQPTPAVDGNVLRVLSRLLGVEEPITSAGFKKKANTALREIYPKDATGDFTQALMELGATVCVPNGAPRCDVCPASAFCVAKAQERQKELPPKPVKKARRKESLTVFLITCGEYVAVCKRPNQGLLRGMWEFPNVAGKCTKEQATKALLKWGIVPTDIVKSVSRGHIFTHVEWNMTGYHFLSQNMPDTLTWVTKEQLDKEIALPTAFKQFTEVL